MTTPPPPAPPRLRVRGMILTAGVAAITIVGTLFGASLKSERDTKQKMISQPGAEDELIAALETRRLGLAQAKLTWEKKAQALRQRIDSNGHRSVGGGSGGTGK